METWLSSSIQWLLLTLALPEVGLSAIFTISLVSATLLPLGSEPAVFGFVKLVPDMFWPAVMVATLGNTIGGIITYGMGLGALKTYNRWREKHGHQHDAVYHNKPGGRWREHIDHWMHRVGPPILFFSWLPVVGDPLCAVAGWLELRFWPSVIYMAIGKCLRYVVMTWALLWFFPHAASVL